MKNFCLLLIACLFSFNAYAELKIDITGGRSEPMPIAVAEFTGVRRADDIRKIVVDDLESSGLFRVINKDAYIQKIKDVKENPRFLDWQAINAQALLVANVERIEDDKLKISFRLWDIYGAQVMIGRAFPLPEREWRRLGHIVADMSYSRITGEGGYFDTRIVYIAETGHAGKRKKRLAMMDQDGANQRYLTDGKTLILTPRFAPNMQKIAYMSYQGGNPRVFLMDLQTMEQKDLGRFEGMSFAPRFSPDSKTLAMSLSKRGNSEIYLYDLESGKRQQITNHPAIDTSPSFSPDGQKIVFNSDRSGSQQLYIMDRDGKNVKRISFGTKGTYATPVWSPRGDYIAFTKIQDGTFYIGIMRPDGSAERLITKGFLVEGPAFAPNGRVLAFFKQTQNDVDDYAKTGIYTIDVTGHNEQYLNTPTDASDPAWSPLLYEKK